MHVVCLVYSELRETVNSLLEEKKNFVCQIHEQQRRIEELTTQVRREQQECYHTWPPLVFLVLMFSRVLSLLAVRERPGGNEAAP